MSWMGPGGRAAARPLRALPCLALVVLAAAAFGPGSSAGLRVRERDGGWCTWWRAGAERIAWDDADLPLGRRAAWAARAPGVDIAGLTVATLGPGPPIDLVLARLDPARLCFDLAWHRAPDSGQPAWSLEDTPRDAVLSLNAGMFLDTLPWGWVVLNGAERLPPGRGPLSSAVAVDMQGRLAWVDGDDVTPLRARADLRLAFQSYPTLLTGDGAIPAALREGAAIDRFHRDARLALGLDRQGRLLVVLTRCGVPLPGADRLPVGLTVPEMAQVMGALGARQAMLLDGGLSAQMQLRDDSGALTRWAGLRRVPLALVVRSRSAGAAAAASAAAGFGELRSETAAR